MAKKSTKLLSILALFAVLILLLAGIVILTSPREDPANTIHLPDGTTFTFLGATFSPTNSIVVGKPWQKSLFRLLPAKYRSWARVRVFDSHLVGYPTNAPTFWVMRTKPNAARVDSSVPNQPTVEYPFHPKPIDEFGCEPFSSGSGSSFRVDLDNAEIFACQFAPDPPFGKVVGLALYDSREQTNRLGVFLMPGVKLPPLPTAVIAEATNGKLKFQLVSFQPGLNSEALTSHFGTNPAFQFTQIGFRAFVGGQPAPSWHPYFIQLTGPNGSPLRSRRHAPTRRDDVSFANLDQILPTNQGPWKLHVEFRRDKDYLPEELVRIDGVPLPAAGRTNLVGKRAEVLGHQIVVEEARGSGTFHPDFLWFKTEPYLVVRLTPPDPANILQLKEARSGQPNSPDYARHIGSASVGGRDYFQLQNLTNAETLNLTFVLLRNRAADFTANPTWYPTNSPPSR